jgi:hypothetical protein
MTRPDTPLAPTPEPQPVSSGLQAAPNMGGMTQQRVSSKYEQTANNAIQQVDAMSQMKMAQTAQAAQPQPEAAQPPKQ